MNGMFNKKEEKKKSPKSSIIRKDQNMNELTETKAACIGPAPGLLCVYYCFQFRVFGILE